MSTTLPCNFSYHATATEFTMYSQVEDYCELDVLTAVLIAIEVFWDMMASCTLEMHHFRGTCCLHD